MRLALTAHSAHELSWREWVAIARTCEDVGLDGLFFADHYLGPGHGGTFDAWSLITGLAPLTERIRLGSLVSPVSFRSAANLAKIVATADHISGGRVELGIGAGWNEEEHRVYDLQFGSVGERLSLVEEQLRAITRHWSATGPQPLQQPRPRVILAGAGGPRALAIAVRHADEYSSIFMAPEEFSAFRIRLDQAGGEHLGMTLAAICVVTGDPTVAERFRQAAAAGLNRFHKPDPTNLIGTIDEVGARLRSYAAAGVERVYLRHPAEHGLEPIRAIGRGLVSAVA